MNRLMRDFSLKERTLLLILGILIVAVAYYYLVHLAVADDLAATQIECESLETELTGVQMRLAQLRKMQNEIDDIESGSRMSRMESYNNAKAEIALLNDILTAANQYSISFSNVTRNGDQIRRSFDLHFTTDSFDMAELIISRLAGSAYRCLVGDVSCSFSNDGEAVISLMATFYETAVGATLDAGLPNDSNAS